MSETAPLDGPSLFARFAYPPNELGYCGPDDHRTLLEYASSGQVDPGLRQLATAFEGAWPYLELIASCNGLDDPLDRRVVEAYWIGNSLSDAVPSRALWRSIDERFRHRAGTAWRQAADQMSTAARPTHAFHVFGVYPFAGLLRSGRVAELALATLDRCRIRPGLVVGRDGSSLLVRSRPVVLQDDRLALAPPNVEVVRFSDDGLSLLDPPEPGTWVALHWDWVCTELSDLQRRRLERQVQVELRSVPRCD